MVFRTDLLGNPTRETNKNYVTSCSMWGQPLSKTWRKCHVQFSRSVPFGALWPIKSADRNYQHSDLLFSKPSYRGRRFGIFVFSKTAQHICFKPGDLLLENKYQATKICRQFLRSGFRESHGYLIHTLFKAIDQVQVTRSTTGSDR